MKKLLLFFAAFTISCAGFSQSSDFRKLESEINSKIGQGQWDQVLLLATDLLIEEPGRGEGYYYTALAFYKQAHYAKAAEYLAQAVPVADAALNTKISELNEQINTDKEGEILLASAENLISSGNSLAAAEDFRKAWELDKINVSSALSAVELFLERENYEAALAILNDPSLSRDPGARALVEKINQTPHMQRVNGYNSAMSQGQEHLRQKNFGMAVSMFEKALSFKSSDPQAVRLKREAQDELAWQGARSQNSIGSYESYYAGNSAGKYRQEALYEIRRGLVYHGEKAALINNVAGMEQHLHKYINEYTGGPQDEFVKDLLCRTYMNNAESLGSQKDAYSQSRALEFYAKVQEYCPGKYDLEKAISSTKKKERRYGRPDRGYMTYVYDSIAPIGLSFGSINNRSLGMYMAGNVNSDLFITTASYTIDGEGNFDGSPGSSVATGDVKTAYGDVILGLTKKIAYPLWIYAGGGAAFSNEIHEFESDSTTEWVQNTDESGIAALVDAGVIVDLSGFSLRGGVKSDLKEYRFSAGLGFSW